MARALAFPPAALALAAMLCATASNATPAAKLGAALGLDVASATEKECVLTNGTDTLRLFPGSRRAELNRRTIWLNSPAEHAAGKSVSIAKADAEKVVTPLFAPPVSTGRTMRVHIDAGHGGEDAGCTSPHTGVHEKDLVLDIAMRVGRQLEARGFEVEYTRTNDTFSTLSERTAIVEKNKGEAFVAIHANFAANQTARGIETYTLPLAGKPPTSAESSVSSAERPGNKFDADSTILGHEIQRRMPGALDDADRGLRHARYQVLRDASCPAVLVEIGFLSNLSDSLNLTSEWYTDRIVNAITDGIAAFADKTPQPAEPAAAVESVEDVEPAANGGVVANVEVVVTNVPQVNVVATAPPPSNAPPAKIVEKVAAAAEGGVVEAVEVVATNVPPAKAGGRRH